MNTVTNPDASQILFSIQLKNRVRGDQLSADVYWPAVHRSFSKVTGRWHESLQSRISICENGKLHEDIVPGGSVVEIFWLSTDTIRRRIPEPEEQDWVNEQGAACWVLLPKTIPIGWGYKLHKHLTALVSAETAKFVDEVDRRRRAYKEKSTRNS